MDPALLEIIKYAPAVGVLALVVWFFLRQQEKRDDAIIKRDENMLNNFIQANERLSSANHQLAELMANHLTELSRSMERGFREILEKLK